MNLRSVGIEMGGEAVPTVTLKMDMSAALLAISYPELSPYSGLELIATKHRKFSWGFPLSPTRHEREIHRVGPNCGPISGL